MVATSLIRLDEAIQSGIKLYEGLKVVLPSCEEAEIYGFLTTEDFILSDNIDMPPLGECQVFSNRVIFYMNNKLHRFPIFSTVCKVSEDRYDLFALYIPRFETLLSDSFNFKAYVKYMGTRQITSYLKSIKINSLQIEKDIAYYIPNENELYFESRSKFRAIGSGVAIITRRISKKSDDIKYEIFDAHSLKMEKNEKETKMQF